MPIVEWTRRETLHRLGSESFDLLIIGGGITGAGLAREAALAGLHTALVERDDFASGTSSRSSRLVHGGVRYLEHGHVGLVFESSQERRRLLQLAPHLVRPLAFTWPVYAGARVPRWKLRAGLAMYDALALFRNVGRHQGLSRDAVLAAEPALARKGLTGGARYWDAATDDSRLTLATVLAAVEHGAAIANHAAVVGGIYDGSRLIGASVRDQLRPESDAIEIRARVVVNATGPWSDITSALTAAAGTSPGETHAEGTHVRGSAGAHISVPRNRVGNREAITLVSPLDGRVMFVLPSGTQTIIGTTEHPAARGPDEIRATRHDVQYLIDSVNQCLPAAELTRDDVIAAWSGIRPLAAVRAGSSSANSASREHAIEQQSNGLLSVTGGKLTTYRAMAADILTHVVRALGTNRPSGNHAGRALDSTRTPLPGGETLVFDDVIQDAVRAIGDQAIGVRLASAYGTHWMAVWQRAVSDGALAVRISPTLPYVRAEVVYAVERHMACTIADVLVRRTHLAFETRDHGVSVAGDVARIMQPLLGWSDAEREMQIAQYGAQVRRLFSIDDD
ncbi:MAG: glycerol-3-phosphate dehydrogenase/oxidase [Gemmatimonadaceae bacterium]|nr:glycerol-3-phosphate dehydrogenase/oxidase [Gemmatimonadaceae bacterium]